MATNLALDERLLDEALKIGTDFLLCAIANRHHMAILTTDEDFGDYAKVIPIVLHPTFAT